jgi:type I restriction enzyme S subunit
MKKVKLNEIYEFSSGLSKPASEFGYGQPFLSFKDVFYNSAVPKVLNQLVNTNTEEISKYSIKKGDVFLTRTSETQDELGFSCVALEDYVDATFNGFTKRLRQKEEDTVVPEYARYFFRSKYFRRQVNAYSTLSTRASLNNEMLSNFEIFLYPLEEQRAIGLFLQRFDNQIELNKKLKNTLEELVKMIFKSWFIDFDPIYSKLNNITSYFNNHINSLFPDDFTTIDNKIIPKNWVIKPLGEAFTWNEGKPWKKENRAEDGKIIAYGANGPVGFSLSEMHNDQAIFVGKIGSCGAINFHNGPFWVSNNSFYLLKNENKYFEFCRYSLLNIDFTKYIGGSSNPYMPFQNFSHHNIIYPTENILIEFEDFASKIQEKIELLRKKNLILSDIRDLLLPKLISGEIKLTEAEKFAKEASI